jgi:putative MATE family efflux protein
MLVMGATVALNVVLDPFLIFGWGPAPRLGIAGAAIATMFSRGLATIVGLGIMFRGDHGVRIRVSDLRPDPSTARELARLGLPASVEGVSRALSVNAFLFIVALFATPVVAAYGIGARVLSVVFLPAVAIGRGVETMSGQNVGANEFDRAAETSRVAAIGLFLVLTALGAVAWVFAQPIVSIFTADAEVIDAGATFLRFIAPSFGFMGIMRAYNGGFRGAGRTLTAAVIVVLTLWVLRLPAAVVGARALGIGGVWLAITASNVLGAVLTYGWFRRGRWREARGTARATVAPSVDD